jgi:hypothetical protein
MVGRDAIRRASCLVVLVAVAACGRSLTPSGTPGVVCCPIQTPGCGCFGYGGAARNGMCPSLCDAGGDHWTQTTDESGCPILVQDPVGGSCLARPDAASDAVSDVVSDVVSIDGPPAPAAKITLSRSTNSPEVDVVVLADGSAERTLAGPSGVLNDGPQSYPPGSPEVNAFLSDLAALGDVSAIPTGKCPKSVSFGTTTTVTVGAATSGDLQCLVDPTPAATALAQDCQILLGTAAP